MVIFSDGEFSWGGKFLGVNFPGSENSWGQIFLGANLLFDMLINLGFS